MEGAVVGDCAAVSRVADGVQNAEEPTEDEVLAHRLEKEGDKPLETAKRHSRAALTAAKVTRDVGTLVWALIVAIHRDVDGKDLDLAIRSRCTALVAVLSLASDKSDPSAGTTFFKAGGLNALADLFDVRSRLTAPTLEEATRVLFTMVGCIDMQVFAQSNPDQFVCVAEHLVQLANERGLWGKCAEQATMVNALNALALLAYACPAVRHVKGIVDWVAKVMEGPVPPCAVRLVWNLLVTGQNGDPATARRNAWALERAGAFPGVLEFMQSRCTAGSARARQNAVHALLNAAVYGDLDESVAGETICARWMTSGFADKVLAACTAAEPRAGTLIFSTDATYIVYCCKLHDAVTKRIEEAKSAQAKAAEAQAAQAKAAEAEAAQAKAAEAQAAQAKVAEAEAAAQAEAALASAKAEAVFAQAKAVAEAKAAAEAEARVQIEAAEARHAAELERVRSECEERVRRVLETVRATLQQLAN
jgi:hypothetical protein